MPQILSVFLTLSSAAESKQKQTLAKHSGRQRVFNAITLTYNFIHIFLSLFFLLQSSIFDYSVCHFPQVLCKLFHIFICNYLRYSSIAISYHFLYI